MPRATPEESARIRSLLEGDLEQGQQAVELIRAGELTHLELDGLQFSRRIAPGISLVGASLQDANLREANLNGANLAGASLKGADLREANFDGADLSRADLSRADLGVTSLRGANLRDADLRDAEFNNILAYVDFQNRDSYDDDYGIEFQCTDLSDADLRGADLTEQVLDLNRVTLAFADLRGAKLPGARLGYKIQHERERQEALENPPEDIWTRLEGQGAWWERAGDPTVQVSEDCLQGAKLDGADLSRAEIELDLFACSLRGADLREAKLNRSFLLCDLSGADLRKAESRLLILDRCDLRGANMREMRYRGALRLEDSDLREADLTDTVFLTDSYLAITRCDLREAKLCRVRLSSSSENIWEGVDLRGADLTDADLSEADLSQGTDLRGVKLAGDRLVLWSWDDTVLLPDGVVVEEPPYTGE